MEYSKIDTLFLRDEKNIIIPSMYTNSVFEELKDLKWEATEKIDGTNMRVEIMPLLDDNFKCVDAHIEFKGRTDKAQIPVPLELRLIELFGGEANEQIFEQNFGEKEVMLVGIEPAVAIEV